MEPIDTLAKDLINTAVHEDWDTIDTEFIPKLSICDGNTMATHLLTYKNDTDPNIRDAVATAFSALHITDLHILEEMIRSMIHMATNDPWIFAAGRAAVYLQKQEDTACVLHNEICDALKEFSKRVTENGWEKELKENIPTLDPNRLPI